MSVLHDTFARYDATDKLKVESTNTCEPSKALRTTSDPSTNPNYDQIWDLVAFDQQQLVDMKSSCIASYLVLSTTSDTIR